MASVFRRRGKDGRKERWYRYKYMDYLGRWRSGKGWPDKQKTLEHVLSVEAEHRAIRLGEKEIPPSWLRERNRPIADVIAEYLKWGRAQGGRRGHPWSERHSSWRERGLRFWVESLGLLTLADIDLGRAEDVAREKFAAGACGKTVNGYVESLKALCTWSVRHGYLKANPLAAMRGFDATPTQPHRALAPDEVKRLLEHAHEDRRLLYRVALETGYRAGELRALKVKDLDLFVPALRLAAQFTKNRRAAVQPITRGLAEEFRALAAGRDGEAQLLGVPHAETVSENFDRDCAAASIVRVTTEGKATFHSLRVNYINAVIEAGSDLKTIMTLARHGSAQMSMEVYAKAKPERLAAAVEAVADGVGKAISASAWCAGGAQAVGAEASGGAIDEQPPGCGVTGMVTPTGFEPESAARHSTDVHTSRERHCARQSGFTQEERANPTSALRHPHDTENASPWCAGGAHPSDLALVVAAWPELPSGVRAAILEMVKGAKRG